MTLVIQLEIGHDASLRTKITPEGFTHDWEVFVRGCGGADIQHYIEKVVFHLHETFPKPRRVVKEPPFSLRTSGYAGFTLPIEIYLRNNQDPKKIWFNYELTLLQTGPPVHNIQKEKYVFHNPSDEFKSRLLKGGALLSSIGNSQDNMSSSNKVDDRNQMTSKPRLSGSDPVKKHKMKFDEPKNSDFLNLFGPPITKTSKSIESVKSKDSPKPIPKLENKVSGDKDKEKSDKSKSVKSSHKDREKDKDKSKDRSSENNEKKNKEEKKKSKDDKSKERERSKDKSKKERERSPRLPSHSPSPKRSPKRSSSPPPVQPKPLPVKEKEYYKDDKKDKEKDEKRDKKEEKKTKKDKRDHKDKDKHKDRDKEKEHKEYKNKEIKSVKDVSNLKTKDSSPIVAPPTSSQVVNKVDKKEKSKEKESLMKESPKEDEKIERNRTEKSEDKSQKHKHKKKDKKEKREERHTKSEKKSDKQSNSTNKFKELLKEPSVPTVSNRESDKSNLFGSPKSEPPSTPDQENHKTTNSVPFKDDDYSIESPRGSSREHSPAPKVPSRSPSPMEQEPIKKSEPEKVKVKEDSPKKKEKKEKKKDKKTDKDHEKKRKRKNENINQEIEEPSEKVMKEEENNNSDDESKVSSTGDINPIPKSECDMDMLRDLQHKIMSLKDNADLQKVVQLIAETGQYEVSANTFDFDLCLLDRSTVKQLQDFFSTVS